MMSSQDIVFVPSDGLKPGMNAEIMVDWPPLLDEGTRLQLVLQVAITGSHGGVTEAHILAYEFRTRGPAENPEFGGYSSAALGPGRVARNGAQTTAGHLRRSGP